MAPAPNLTSSIHSLKHTHTHWGLEIACWWWKKVLNIKTELVVLMENDMPPFSHPQPPQPPSPFLLFTDLYRQSFCSCTFSSVQHSGITGWICWFWWIIHFIFYSNCYSSYAVKVKYMSRGTVLSLCGLFYHPFFSEHKHPLGLGDELMKFRWGQGYCNLTLSFFEYETQTTQSLMSWLHFGDQKSKVPTHLFHWQRNVSARLGGTFITFGTNIWWTDYSWLDKHACKLVVTFLSECEYHLVTFPNLFSGSDYIIIAVSH